MATYEHPVSRLLALGRPMTNRWEDYASHGIGQEHIPELIRLLQDRELAWPNEDKPATYCQLHAWRALAKLKAETAIEPLLDLLADQELDDDWIDWVTEDVPAALGVIGPPALGPTAKRLEETYTWKRSPGYYGQVLGEIAKHYPETRDEVVRRLMTFLEHASDNDATMNGFIICELLDLKAVEAWPVIEKAFESGNVDESIGGGPAEVKYDLGLGPKPPCHNFQHELRSQFGLGPFQAPAPLSAKARAQNRAKQKKAAKRKKRRGR